MSHVYDKLLEAYTYVGVGTIRIPCRRQPVVEYTAFKKESHRQYTKQSLGMGIIYFYSCARQLNAKYQNQI